MIRLAKRAFAFAIICTATAASLVAVTRHTPGSLGAISNTLAEPFDVFSQRSPGRRPSGALSDTKPKRRLVLAQAPRMPHMLMLPYVSDAQAPTGGVDPAPFGTGGFMNAPLAPDLSGPLNDLGTLVDRGNGGSASSPPSDVGGTGPPIIILLPPVDNISPTPTPIVDEGPGQADSAVPEPATWLTMILGFLGIGTVLRRNGRRLPQLIPPESQ